MNEIYLLSQIVCILLFTSIALRIGKQALICLVAAQALFANLFVLKQMLFFGMEVTCSDAFAIGSILGLNLLREYFGVKTAKKAISITFLLLAFFVVVSQIHLHFHPSPHDTAQFAYTHLLTPAPRLLIASLVSFFLTQHFDVRCFGWISRLLPRSRFPLRTSLSMTASQFLDTLLFSFLGLFGLVANLAHIIIVSFLLKLAIIFALGPLTTYFKRQDILHDI